MVIWWACTLYYMGKMFGTTVICVQYVILKNWWLLLWTNLSRGDKVALRGASKRQLLLGNHHHLGAGRVDMSGSDRSWTTTRLYPWSTGGHGWSVLIVSLKNIKGRMKEEWWVHHRMHTQCWSVCKFSVSTMVVLTHVIKCCSIIACLYVSRHIPLLMGMCHKNAQNRSECHVSLLHWCLLKLRGVGTGTKRKAVTCNALYPPFSRTTHEQRAREAVRLRWKWGPATMWKVEITRCKKEE